MQITNLPASSSFASNDVLAIEVNGTTYKVTGATLAAALQTIGEFVTTSDTATTTQDGLMIASDKAKLNGISAGAQVNSITGVKGNAEGSYRVGNINLTPANIGALALSGGTMTGGIDMGQSGSSTTSQNLLFTSENGTEFYVRTYANGLQFARKPSGGNAASILNCYSDGTIGLTNSAAWRSALGIVLASGSQTFSNLASGSQTNSSISFSQSIGTTNYIVVTQPNVARCAIGIQSKTVNGFEMYCRNVSPDTSSPAVAWAAIALG